MINPKITEKIMADTCALEYSYKGGYAYFISKVYGTSLITPQILSEVGVRIPEVLNIIDYAVIQLNEEERELAYNIVDYAVSLFGKHDLTLADASIIAVSSNRNINIFTDNGVIVWFFNEFLIRNYSKEPYKSSQAKFISEIKYYPEIYTSSDFLFEIHGDNLQIDILSDYTAKSAYWFPKEFLDMQGIDHAEYIRAVFELKRR